MQRVEKTVFISYRRTNAPWALAVFQNLTNHGYDVFYDYEGLASGDFEQVILGNIKARAHFLVLLSPSALERCDEPGDWLRREIETAIDTRRNIVPLMLDRFDFGTPEIAKRLTGKLALLKRYNALEVPPAYFSEAMDRLRQKHLNVPLDAVLHPASKDAQTAAKHQQTTARKAPAVREDELTAQQWFERGYAATNRDEQLRCYTEAIRLMPGFPPLYLLRGLLREGKGDRDGARSDYDEALRLNPKYAEAYEYRGYARKATGDLDGAISDLDEAIRLNPDVALAHKERADIRRKRGDLDGDLSDLDEAIRLNRKDAVVYGQRGISRASKGDIEGAISDLGEAIRLNPENDLFYGIRGTIRHSKGDLDSALSDFDEAIRLNPEVALVHKNRADVRSKKGDLDGALSDLGEVVRLNPEDAMAYLLRGLARKAKGDLDGAISDHDKAIRLNPQHANAYYNRAELFEANRKYVDAIADFQKYLDLGGGVRDGDQAEVEERIRSLMKKGKPGRRRKR